MSKLTPGWQRTSVLESVFDQLSDALVLYDPEFRITGVNRAAEKLFGMSSEEMLGKHCQEIFRCSVCEPNCGVLVGLNQPQAAPNCTVRLHTDNGMERLVVMRTNQMFDDAGELAGVVATIKDITEEAAPQKREVIAESPCMREMMNFVRRVSASEATTILLEGENGTGKDLIAKTLHYQSVRQAEPFIAINCAAIPETLLESELFGYEKGAFTDARSQKRGIFELADKGTLFLDEIGEIPLMLQAKLLRVLEEQIVPAAGRPEGYSPGSAGDCGHQQEPARSRQGRRLPAGPLFPAERNSDSDSALARSHRRHRADDQVLHRALQSQVQAKYRKRHRCRGKIVDGARLAGQRSRIAQRHRAGHDPGGRHIDHRGESADLDRAAGRRRAVGGRVTRPG